jgi:hypothetical protein
MRYRNSPDWKVCKLHTRDQYFPNIPRRGSRPPAFGLGFGLGLTFGLIVIVDSLQPNTLLHTMALQRQ